jgi:hypothetical protein
MRTRLKLARRTGAETVAGQPRMQALYAAAIACRGDVARMLRSLDVTPRLFAHRLSILRGEQVASTVYLHDPRRRGRPVEAVLLVEVSDYRATSLLALEDRIRADEAVSSAARVTGQASFRLQAFHPDQRAAELWSGEIAAWPGVRRVSLSIVRTLFGDALAGIRLEHGREGLGLDA